MTFLEGASMVATWLIVAFCALEMEDETQFSSINEKHISTESIAIFQHILAT